MSQPMMPAATGIATRNPRNRAARSSACVAAACLLLASDESLITAMSCATGGVRRDDIVGPPAQ